jgi:hypothetical protein
MKYLLKPLLITLALFIIPAAAFAVDVPRTPTGSVIAPGVQLFTWAGLDGDDTGVPVNVAKCKQLTAHVYSGTYGSSTVTVEGSNDPAVATSTEWVGLADINGNAVSKTADAIEQIAETPYWFRPKTASGTSANIAVGLVCRY